MANAAATVAFIDGQAWAKAPDGSLRALALGDVLNADEVLITAEGARVELDFGDSSTIAIAGGQEVGMGPDLWEITVTDPSDAALADASVQQALTILNEGGDLFDELEAPAAGGGESSGGGGNSFVQVERAGQDAFAAQEFMYGSVSRATSSGVLEGQSLVNGAPVSADLSFDLEEDTSLSSLIVAQDPENDVLSFALLTSPAHGTLTLNPATGEFVYQPAANYVGADSFVVSISDPRGNTTTSTVSLNVIPVNDAPTADNLNLQTNEDVPVDGQVVAEDIEGDNLAYLVSSVPENGIVVIDSATGEFTYTPNNNYFGSDTFVVTVDDGNGGTTTSTITIDVLPVNDAPVSNDIHLITNEDTSVAGQVPGTDVDDDTLTFTVTTPTANGSVSLDPATGAFIYTPNPDYNGSDSFVVTVDDGNGGSTTSLITIGVLPINDAPVTANLNLITPEDTPVPGTIQASDVDGDVLTYGVGSGPANGSVNLDPATGKFVYTPNANYNGSDSFNVTVSDGNGGTAISVVTIGVTPVDDAPTPVNQAPVTVDQNLTTDENVALNGAISASDPDGDTLSYSISGAPANGSVTLNPTTGSFAYTPNTDYAGGDSFVVTVNDGKGGSTTSTVSLNVIPVNDAPTADNLNLQTNEDVPVNGQVVAEDIDGDNLAYLISSVPANGTVVIDNATGEFTYTPNNNYFGSDTFVVTVDDGNGGSTTSLITIGVLPVNDAPVTANLNLITPEDTPVPGTIQASDVDGDALTYGVGSGPANGSVSLDPATGQFVYTPNANYNGSDSFNVTVSDGNGGTAISVVTIGVTPVNQAPVSTNQNLTTDENVALNGAISASDPDGDTLTYSISGAPANGSVTLNSTTGSFVYTPNTDYSGGDSFVVTVNDGNGSTTTSTITIGVNAVNGAPVANDDTVSVIEGDSVTVDVRSNDTDPENDSLTVTGVTQGANGSVLIDTPTGNPIYTPNAGFSGTDSFTYTIGDGNGGEATATVLVNVSAANQAPDTNPINVSGDEDTPIVINLSGSDSDGSVAGFLINSLPNNGVLYTDAALTQVIAANDVVAGPVYFKPNADWSGSTNFTYAARDSQGLEDTTPATVAITIDPVADPAALSADLGTVKEDTPAQAIASGVLSIADPDEGQEGFQPQANTAGIYGSFSIDIAGSWSYAIDNSNPLVQALKEGEARTEVFTVRSIDGTGTTVTITVIGTNDAPIANADSAMTETGVAVTFAVRDNDSDLDGDPLTVTGAVVDATEGSVMINADGTLTFTPAPGFLGTATVTYTISDGHGATDTAIASVLVHPVNTPPVAVNDPGGQAYSVYLGNAGINSWETPDSKGQSVTISAINADGSPGTFFRGGDRLGVAGTPRSSATANAEPTQIEYNPFDNTSESILVNVNGNLTGASFSVSSLVASESGGEVGVWTAYYQGTVVSSDSFRLLTGNAGTFTIDTDGKIFDSVRFSSVHTRNGTGDGSGYFLTGFTGTGTAEANSSYLIAEDGVLDISVASGTHLLANDSDLDSHSLVLTHINGLAVANGELIVLPSGASLTINIDGSFRYSANGNFDYLRAGELATDSFTYTVADGFGGSSTAAAAISIVGGSEAPLAIDDGLVVNPGEMSVIPASALIANDSDPDADSLVIQSAQDAINGSVILSNGAVIFTPTTSEGFASFSYTIRDPSGLTSTATANLTVASALAPSVVVAKSLVAVAVGNDGVSVKFPITTSLVDTDGSETLSIRVLGVPTGASFNMGTNLGGGIWSFVDTDLANLQLVLPGSYATGATGTIMTVEVTATEITGNLTATTSSTLRLIADYTTNPVITTEDGNFSGLGANDFIQGGSGNNTVNGGNGNDLIYGGAGNDAINGGNGNDILFGGAGDDVINGGAGSDRISGGAGNDIMSGNNAVDTTVDVFVWSLGDEGAAGAPAIDTINQFNSSPAAATSGGDVLDLRDLLVGESVGPGNSAGNLADYLHFEVAGGNTVIHVSHTGGFTGDDQAIGAGYTGSAETQQIILTGVDLTSVYSGATTDQEIITQLLNSNKLITD